MVTPQDITNSRAIITAWLQNRDHRNLPHPSYFAYFSPGTLHRYTFRYNLHQLVLGYEPFVTVDARGRIANGDWQYIFNLTPQPQILQRYRSAVTAKSGHDKCIEGRGGIADILRAEMTQAGLAVGGVSVTASDTPQSTTVDHLTTVDSVADENHATETTTLATVDSLPGENYETENDDFTDSLNADGTLGGDDSSVSGTVGMGGYDYDGGTMDGRSRDDILYQLQQVTAHRDYFMGLANTLQYDLECVRQELDEAKEELEAWEVACG